MNKVLLVLMLITGAGATTGLVLHDALTGETTVAVSQAILVDYTQFGASDVSGADEALVTVMDDGTSWSVHVEANNGDIINIDLPVVNEADQRIVAMMSLHGTAALDLNIDPLFYWSDRNHDGRWTHNEAVLDQRPTTDKLKLERDDIVVATGWTDYNNFTADHWFFDGSYTAPGTYGFGGIYGPSYDDDMFSDYDGEDPEAILLDDGDGILNPGVLANGSGSADELVLTGRAGLARELGPYASAGLPAVSGAVGQLYFDASGGSSWAAGKDLFLNNDGDGYFTLTADGLVDDDGTSSSGIGGAGTPIVVGTLFDGFDTSDSVYWDDSDVSGDWSAGDHLWLDAGDNTYFNANGESISDAGPATDLSTTINPSLKIAFDGGAATTYVLESSNAISAATLSELGLEATPAGFSAGDVVEVAAQGNYYIVSSTSGAGGSATLRLIGDVATVGDSVKANTLDRQSLVIGAQVGSVTVAGAQSIGADGSKSLSVDDGFGGTVDASGLTAGSVYLIDDDGTPDAGSAYVVMDAVGGNPTSAVSILGQALKTLRDNDVFYGVTPSDSGTTADLDDFYLNSATDIASALDNALGGAGTATYGSAGFANLYKVDSTSVGAGSSVVVTNAASDNVADDLKLGVANGGDENGPDLIIRNAPVDDTDSGVELDTAGSSHKFGYLDLDNDNTYDDGEDIYQEETAGALTYTTAGSLPETVVYVGANGLQLNTPTAATYLESGDNVWFANTDHDSPADYDLGEPLIVSGDLYLGSGDEVLARYDAADWPVLASLDAYRLETDFDGANGHHYYYVDDSNDQWYDYDEAIIDQIAGADLINLEKSDLAPNTDFVIHHGLANLMAFPVVQVEGQAGQEWWGTWKFEVPNVNIIGDPLEIRIIVAIEDAAPTGFYEISGRIWPVNV